MTIEQTEVRNNGGDGIDLNGGTGTLLQNLVVHSNGGRGAWIHGGASGTRTLNSTLYGNTGVGLQCDTGAPNTQVRNTIAYGNTGGNILNNCGATVARNLCAATSADCALGADPLFVAAPTDLHLGEGSPAINAGELISSITVDYDGNPRQQDAQDIGAYERTQPTGGGESTVVTERPCDLRTVGMYF
jgi:Right handed beta helix region